ncbi:MULTISPECIES: glycosyltransferase [unclassified Bradyrhizobium]|uniref:glycosyltransferase n=1 Tax=unclassified Bradyrhizobium TaxID=2631580 RepID=UPI003399E302
MIAVIITAYNQARFLEESIQSCLRQRRPPDEIIVVDDGSADDPASVVERHPKVRLIAQDNRGLAAARNAGLAAAASDYITFLDADDRLLSGALEIGERMLARHPEAVLAYGAYRYIDSAGEIISGKNYVAKLDDPYLQFLRIGNFIGMHATVIYRSDRLAAVNGFNEAMLACEDYELFARLAKIGPLVSHDNVIAEYRMHNANMSRNRPMMLAAALKVLDGQLTGNISANVQLAVQEGRRFWKDYYASELSEDAFKLFGTKPIRSIRMSLQAMTMSPAAALEIITSRVKSKIKNHLRSFI